MNRRYRVLHLITRLELGGAQQNTLYCARHHDRDRFDVELIAGRGFRLDDEAQAIPDAKVQLVPWLKHSISPPSDLLAVLKLRNYFRRAGIAGCQKALQRGPLLHQTHRPRLCGHQL